jgi:hypothetical protein
VIDRLRLFMHRPLADADRARMFLVAVAAIVVGAAALAMVDEPPAAKPAAAPDRAATPTGQMPADQAPALALPSEEGAGEGAVASRRVVDAAKAAARRFLAGYLPYTYREKPAREIHAATDELRRRLTAAPPRVPAAERKRRPRVLLLHAEGAGTVHAAIVALVGDGARRYTVQLELEQRRSGWTVTNVGR